LTSRSDAGRRDRGHGTRDPDRTNALERPQEKPSASLEDGCAIGVGGTNVFIVVGHGRVLPRGVKRLNQSALAETIGSCGRSRSA
jgi:hypothetical protein